MRLGISPIGWTNQSILDLGDDVPFERFARDAAEAGFTGVELGRKFPADPRACRSALADYGLVPVTGWYSGELARRSAEAEGEAVQPFARHLRALGSSLLVYGECGHGPAGGSAARLADAIPFEVDAAYAARVDAFAAELASAGLTLVYHPHMMQAVDTDARIHRLMELTGPAVQLLLDTGHVAMSGGDWIAIARRWWHRIGHIHLKDIDSTVLQGLDPALHSFDDGVRMGLFTVPGSGSIDFSPLARLIAEHGYDGWCIVEAERDPATIPPGDLARRSYAYLTRIFAEAGVAFDRPVAEVAR